MQDLPIMQHMYGVGLWLEYEQNVQCPGSGDSVHSVVLLKISLIS